MSEQVDILLATFQGGNYLEEQLESILTQTHCQLHLWIRDDGSTDQTLSIIRKWAQAYPQKITLLPTGERLGVKGNFSTLMKHSRAPYIMFADQDDQWLPSKVEMSLDHMKSMERQYGSHLPLVVHTDLKVVDEQLRERACSYCHYVGLNPYLISLNRLLSQNVITGCTMLVNRSLINLAYPIPQEAIMHDWWMALIASCFGHIHFLDHATILYRQHSQNDTGAQRYHLWHFLIQIADERQKKEVCAQQTYQQAALFLERYQNCIPLDKKMILQAYVDLGRLPYFKKKYQTFRYQFFKHGFLRNAKMLLE